MAALISLGGVLPTGVTGQVMDPDTKWTNAAMAFVKKLDTGDFAGASAMSAPAVASHFPADQLEAIWKQIAAGGGVHSMIGAAVNKSGALYVVDLNLVLGSSPARFRVAVDDDLKINGFFVLPPASPSYTAPSYVSAEKFEEVPMRIKAGTFELPAMLSIPKGVAHPPVVVLVHGSGPNDMDESIGPNRPFKDIAWGLASRGIAVLRYDKRTKVGAGRMGNTITVDQEVIEDALSALDSARANPRLDAKRSFLLGHSLGAMLAPEIAARDGKLAGVLVVAGTPRDLAAVMVYQFTYLKSLPANSSADAQHSITDAQAQLERLVRKEPKPEELIMGAPASYFYDLASRDAMKHATSLRIPMFFLQGGRDYQVLSSDLELWKKGLAGHANTSFKLYPDLNHLFMTGTGKATPTEYTVAGHVKEDVIEDIAKFIRR